MCCTTHSNPITQDMQSVQPLASAKLWEQLREACTAFFQVRACAPCMPCGPDRSACHTETMPVCLVWLHVRNLAQHCKPAKLWLTSWVRCQSYRALSCAR